MATAPSPAARKAARVLAITPAPEVDPTGLGPALLVDLRRHVVGAIADPARAVDRIEHSEDVDHFFLGYSSGIVRLLASLSIDAQARSAEVTLRATKADRDALAETDWGDQGADVGNSVLVARVFHVAIVVLRRGGIVALVNRPFDARVRARYSAMGFESGSRLELTDARALTRAFGFVGGVYAGTASSSMRLRLELSRRGPGAERSSPTPWS